MLRRAFLKLFGITCVTPVVAEKGIAGEIIRPRIYKCDICLKDGIGKSKRDWYVLIENSGIEEKKYHTLCSWKCLTESLKKVRFDKFHRASIKKVFIENTEEAQQAS